MWYDEPVNARIEKMEWYAARRDEHAAKARSDASGFPGERTRFLRTAELHDDRAKHLRALADEMRRTGKVLA